MKGGISSKLFNRLNKGKLSLGNEARDCFVKFIQSQLLDDQSFKDKSGISDLYYTGFGWILCLVLGIRLDTQKMSVYLKKQQEEGLDLIHYASLKRCELILQLMASGKILTWLRLIKTQSIKPLHKFNHIPHLDIYAPYSQFIWMLLLEATGNRKQSDVETQKVLTQYQLPQGGYKNSSEGASATTNATTAALSVLGETNGYKTNKDIVALKSFQDISGGFWAVKSAPVPDLLSTATALFTLSCYKEVPTYPPSDFIEAHWTETGGFVATLMDNKSDVEYCFYGLLALGCV